jgi:hypothetical protein
MNRTLFVVLSTVLVICHPAFAATVDSVSGKVSINRGAGYAPAESGMTANPGDQVMAAPKGYARIIYSNGCVVEVRPGSVVRVSDRSPCRAGGYFATSDFLPGMVPFAVTAGIIGGAFAITTSNEGNGPGASGGNGLVSRPASP